MANIGTTGTGGTNSSATRLVPVVPDDNNDLPSQGARAIYVGSSGDIHLTLANDTTDHTLPSVLAGIFPVVPKRIYATGTAATGMFLMF